MDKENNAMAVQGGKENKVPSQTEAMISLLTKCGVLADGRVSDEKRRKAQQEKKKNSYHNTLMLLQHYRTIIWVMECFPETIEAELDRPLKDLDALLSCVDAELSMGNRRLESRLEEARKSRLLIDRVNEALTVLKKKPGNGKKLYQLIYLSYIAPERLSHTELLYRLDISSRHYYRLRQQAITILSIRLWSAPGVDVDFWLELLTVLEGLDEE